jgi:hypothetical protein
MLQSKNIEHVLAAPAQRIVCLTPLNAILVPRLGGLLVGVVLVVLLRA